MLEPLCHTQYVLMSHNGVELLTPWYGLEPSTNAQGVVACSWPAIVSRSRKQPGVTHCRLRKVFQPRPGPHIPGITGAACRPSAQTCTVGTPDIRSPYIPGLLHQICPANRLVI